MSQPIELSSEERKLLRGMHLLYTKITGDVVWVLFEEQECSQEDCGIYMDKTLAIMSDVLGVMHQLETGEKKYLVFDTAKPANAENVMSDMDICDTCKPFVGKAVTTDDTDWYQCLAPFAVECRVQCKALSATEFAESVQQYELVAAKTLQRPHCELLCPLFKG